MRSLLTMNWTRVIQFIGGAIREGETSSINLSLILACQCREYSDEGV